MHIHLFLCIRLFRFFFSSRRRHTRCSRDWSSDVCSSDLKAGAHGELCGLLAIRSALEARGDMREVVLVPESADRKSVVEGKSVVLRGPCRTKQEACSTTYGTSGATMLATAALTSALNSSA